MVWTKRKVPLSPALTKGPKTVSMRVRREPRMSKVGSPARTAARQAMVSRMALASESEIMGLSDPGLGLRRSWRLARRRGRGWRGCRRRA